MSQPPAQLQQPVCVPVSLQAGLQGMQPGIAGMPGVPLQQQPPQPQQPGVSTSPFMSTDSGRLSLLSTFTLTNGSTDKL